MPRVEKSEYHFAYMMASYSRVIHIGYSPELNIRVQQHKNKIDPDSFTARYNVSKLVYFERFSDADRAIAREKQWKRWSRWKKICLIAKHNPEWRDLSEDSGDPRDLYKPEMPGSSTRFARSE